MRLRLAAADHRRAGLDTRRPCLPRPTRASKALAAINRSFLRLTLDPDRRFDDVLEGGHVREEIEALEDHADLGAFSADLALRQLVDLAAVLPVSDQLAVDGEPAGIDLLEVVDAAKEGALARSGWADDAHHLARRHLEVDASEHLEASIGLMDVLGTNHWDRHQRITSQRMARKRAAPARLRQSGSRSCAWKSMPAETLQRCQRQLACRPACEIPLEVVLAERQDRRHQRGTRCSRR